METTVIHIRDRQPSDVYIGRAGKGESGFFGNPFFIGRDGNRAEVLVKFRTWFLNRIATDPAFKERVLGLVGKRLVCFCHPSECHGDVIAAWCNYEGEAEAKTRSKKARRQVDKALTSARKKVEMDPKVRVVCINDPTHDEELSGWDGPGWYFWDETEAYCHGPFATKGECEAAMKTYAENL